MPLESGSSKQVISNNIRELYKANAGKKKKRSKEQIIAIALSQARKSKGK